MELFAIGIYYEYFNERKMEYIEDIKIKYVFAHTVEEAFEYVEQHIDECFMLPVKNPKVNRSAYTKFKMDGVGFIDDKMEFYP